MMERDKGRVDFDRQQRNRRRAQTPLFTPQSRDSVDPRRSPRRRVAGEE